MATWTTKNELAFLKNIGTYNKNSDIIECLKGYIRSCKNRDNWEKIDEEVVLRTAKGMLLSMGESV